MPVPAATPAPTTCAEAQALVLGDEKAVQRLQQSVARQEAQLDRLLASAARQSSSASRSGTSGSGASSSAGSTTTVSAARLAADQAAVDAAQAQVAVAEQNLAQAVLISPIDGVVSSVGLTAGSTATAGSSSSAVDVIDPDAHTVVVSVDVSKVPLVKVGQRATVVPDGTSQQLAATVSYVAPAPSTSGGSTYPVRLAFTSAPAGLHDGIQAAVSLVVAQATGLAVPTSAVGHLGQVSYVLVSSGSTARRQLVSVGAVGPQYTQVTKGLSAGQQVVIANIDEPIPTSTLNGRFARFAGAGGGGLGGLGGGGFVAVPGPGRG
jgi:RND family efflux transporter MFP subunit